MVLKSEENQSINTIAELFSSLTSTDALKIFRLCERGINSSTRAIKELGLTQKRYYSWLNRLMAVSLIEKRNSIYIHTMMGKVCNKLLNTLTSAVNQSDKLELANIIMSSDSLTVSEKAEILRAISKEDFLGTASLVDIIHEVKMIIDYGIFVDEVINQLDSAKKSAYVAANKTDVRIMESTFRVIDRGLNFYFMSSTEKGFSESIQALRMLLNPGSIKVIRKLISSKELNIRVLDEKLSHSFVITDGEYGIIELPHPISNDFYVAFKFQNTLFCQKLKDAFMKIFEGGIDDPRIEFIKKTLGFL